MKLTEREVAALALWAGFTKGQATVMVAIAIPESGLETTASSGVVVTPEGVSAVHEGIWQEQVPVTALEPGETFFTSDEVKKLHNPFTAARRAKAKHSLQGYGAWDVYDTGKYKDYMQTAGKAVDAMKGQAYTDTISNLRKRIGDDGFGIEDVPIIGDAVDEVTEAGGRLIDNVQRLVPGVVGVLFLAIAVIIMFLAAFKTPVAKTLKTVAGAAAVGKVLK